MRFRAWGLYTQGDGRGTRGDEMPFFMMRVRTPNGLLTSDMVRRISDISDTYARSSIDITNRQNFQLHWLRIEDIPTIWESLGEVGWTSMGACGDNPRTVTGCSLAGVEHDELIDASPIAVAVDTLPERQPRLRQPAAQVQDHDHRVPALVLLSRRSTTSAPRRSGAPTASSASTCASAAGSRPSPHLAVLLPAFVHPDQVPEVVEAITAIFRDSDELRVQPREGAHEVPVHQSRLDRGVVPRRDRAAHRLQARRAGAEDNAPEGHYRDHIGVHPQKQAGSATRASPSCRDASRPISCAASPPSPTNSATARCD